MKEFIEKLIGRLEKCIFSKSEILEYNTENQKHLISRNKGIKCAIKIVNELAEQYKDKDCSECSRRKFYQQGYEDARKNNGWIPCRERLPETYDDLLICQSDGYVNVGWYSLNEFKDVNSIPYKNVIAWQPLPQPYKEGSE